MNVRTTAAVGVAAVAVAGAGLLGASLLTSSATTDQDIFCTEFVPNMEASNLYKKWASQSPGEKTKWLTFRTAICADEGPAPPVMASSFGKALVAAGEMALEIAPPPTTTTTTTPPPTAQVAVATNGNDSTCVRGDLTKPCLTFQRAYLIASKGDRVLVRNGNYPGQSMAFDPAKGNTGPAVTFQAETCHEANLTGLGANTGLGGASLTLGRYSDISPPSWVTFDCIDSYKTAIMQRTVQSPNHYAIGITIRNMITDCKNCGWNLNAVGVDQFTLDGFENVEGSCCATEGLILIGSAGPPSSFRMSSNVVFDRLYLKNVDQLCVPYPGERPLWPNCASESIPANPNVHPDCIQSGRPIINFEVRNSTFEWCEENNFSATDICQDNSEQWTGRVTWRDNVFVRSRLFDLKMYGPGIFANCNVPAFPDSAVVEFINNTFSKDFPEIRNAHPSSDVIATGNRSPTRPPGTQGITNSNGACKTASYAGYAGFTTYQSSGNVYGNGTCGPTDTVN